MQKEEILKQLGAHIRKLREDKSMSQSDLSSLIGKDQQSIQRLEAGKINPSYYYLHQIAEGLSISVSELINFTPHENATP